MDIIEIINEFTEKYNYVNISSISLNNKILEMKGEIIDGFGNNDEITDEFFYFFNSKYEGNDIEKIKVNWTVTPKPKSYTQDEIDKMKDNDIKGLLFIFCIGLMYLVGTSLILYYFFN